MFAAFSRGYYVGRMQVEPHGGDDALMQRRAVEAVNEQLYATGNGVERTDYPLVMKLWQRHFPVHADTGVPEHTLLIPDRFIHDPVAEPLPSIREVLLAKPPVVRRLMQWSGDGSDVVAT